MLSSIGRASVRRVVAHGPQSTNRALPSVWQSQRVDTLQHADTSSVRPQFRFSLRRSYATATKVATRPRVSKTTPAAKTKTEKVVQKVTKKPVKQAVKKPLKKSVEKPVKKKAVAKKPVKKSVKVLTQAQKLKKEHAKRVAHKKALKEAALVNPKLKPETAWLALVTEMTKKNDVPGANAASSMREAAIKYDSFSPAEKEAYSHIAAQNSAENQVIYKKWVESYTPEQIRAANTARRALRLLNANSTKGPKIKVHPRIKDERLPKRPRPALALFTSDKWASGDLKGIKLTEASKLIYQEWQSLPASSKQAYEERHIAEQHRYVKEHIAAYNRVPDAVNIKA